MPKIKIKPEYIAKKIMSPKTSIDQKLAWWSFAQNAPKVKPSFGFKLHHIPGVADALVEAVLNRNHNPYENAKSNKAYSLFLQKILDKYEPSDLEDGPC